MAKPKGLVIEKMDKIDTVKSRKYYKIKPKLYKRRNNGKKRRNGW